MSSVYYDFVVSWLFYFIICSGKNISRTIMKATSLVQCHFIHKSFLFYNVTWMSCKSCWIFYWPQNRSSCVYLSFFHRALQSSHLSGEEMNGRFFPSASCILFFFLLFFHSDLPGQQWSSYLSMHIRQGVVESLSCVNLSVLV